MSEPGSRELCLLGIPIMIGVVGIVISYGACAFPALSHSLYRMEFRIHISNLYISNNFTMNSFSQDWLRVGKMVP